MFQVYIEPASVMELQSLFKGYEKRAPEILARAANRAAVTVAASIRQEIRDKYYVKAGDIKASEHKTNATKAKPYATIRYTASHLNLMRWDDNHGKSVVTYSPHKRGLISTWTNGPDFYKARVMKGHRPIKLGEPGTGDEIPFVNRSKRTGKTVMMRRLGKDSYPTQGVSGPDYTQLVLNKDVRATFTKKGSDMMYNRILHEIARIKSV